jgi:hypothetical protein
VSYKSQLINIQVSRRILWIGAEAYPLQNIARAQTIRIAPDRGAAVRHYLIAVAFWVFLYLGAAAAMKSQSLSLGNSASEALTAVEWVAAALVVISTIRLIVVLARPIFYALIIETAGDPRTALISTQQHVVTSLVRRIMDAIDNPQAEFQLQVENFHVGDKIQQFGSQNVGKVSR